LPGSIIDNALTQELRSYLVGQIARAVTLFCVDEIVIFSSEDAARSAVGVGNSRTDGSVFMARVLQYLECPQYLRKSIFPMHPDLRCVGALAPLDAFNHPRSNEQCPYREGLISEKPAGEHCSYAEVGLQKEIPVDRTLPAGTRVTVRMPNPSFKGGVGVVVPPREPRERLGLHWGYSVRIAKDLHAVWSECPFSGGYDLSVGSSDKGEKRWMEPDFRIPSFKHLLLVFGGLEGLEPVVGAHPDMAMRGVDAESLFDFYLNLCPWQGSRTIRTEEAVFVGLAALQQHMRRANAALVSTREEAVRQVKPKLKQLPQKAGSS
jgi:predicted SPOUT superfamily RNA methylase MTH1